MGLSDSPLHRRCGAEDETSAHILCECEALASLRLAYLGSFFLEPEDFFFFFLEPEDFFFLESEHFFFFLEPEHF